MSKKIFGQNNMVRESTTLRATLPPSCKPHVGWFAEPRATAVTRVTEIAVDAPGYRPYFPTTVKRTTHCRLDTLSTQEKNTLIYACFARCRVVSKAIMCLEITTYHTQTSIDSLQLTPSTRLRYRMTHRRFTSRKTNDSVGRPKGSITEQVLQNKKTAPPLGPA